MADGQGSDPPGAVSNQNQEEQESGLGHEQDQSAEAHKDESQERGAAHEDDSPGASTEGSQATGHPENAG